MGLKRKQNGESERRGSHQIHVEEIKKVPMAYPMEDAELCSLHFTLFLLSLTKSDHSTLLKSSQPFIAFMTKQILYQPIQPP